MYDLVIRGGFVVDPDTTTRSDIAIKAGKIAAIGTVAPNAPAASVIDATDLHILPGLVDAHVHLREPGLVHKEGFLTGTQAAAAGGVTTVMVMPTDNPLTLTPEEFEKKRMLAEKQCHVDYALQAGLGPDLNHVSQLRDLGAISFEIFLADIAPQILIADAETLLDALKAIERIGGIAGITPGDHDVVTKRTTRIRQAAKGAWEEFPPTRPPISEVLGVGRACIAARYTGARVHLRQISCESSIPLLQTIAKDETITAEVTPHNLTLDENEFARQGPFAKVAPPLRPRSDVEAMQRAIRERVISIVATDHAPHLPSEKEEGRNNIWNAPGGLPGLQTFLPVMLNLVDNGVMTINDVVRVCAANPARIFGLVGRKGSILPGADADLVILDRRKMSIVRNKDQYSKAKITPFQGLSAKGEILRVLLRGKEIVRDGRIVGLPRGVFVQPT